MGNVEVYETGEDRDRDRERKTTAGESNLPYRNREELPDPLREVLPVGAQDVYVEAYRRNWNAYDTEETSELGRAGVAHRQAWEAVKQEYMQAGPRAQWYRRDEAPAEEEEDESIWDRLRDLFQ